MLLLLRVNPWHVTKLRFIQCLLGGRKASHSKALQYHNIKSKINIRDCTEENLVAVGVSAKICPGDPINKV